MRAILLVILAMLVPAGPGLAQATERTVYASVVDKMTRPSRDSPPASSWCAKTMRFARCCAYRRLPNRCRLRCSSTRVRR